MRYTTPWTVGHPGEKPVVRWINCCIQFVNGESPMLNCVFLVNTKSCFDFVKTTHWATESIVLFL
jgi:hypothetical protein